MQAFLQELMGSLFVCPLRLEGTNDDVMLRIGRSWRPVRHEYMDLSAAWSLMARRQAFDLVYARLSTSLAPTHPGRPPLPNRHLKS